MGAYLAFCSDIPGYRDNRVLDADTAARHPGSGWVRVLAERLRGRGMDLITGDVALADIEAGRRRAEDAWVISEEESGHAAALCAHGARPLAIFCFESPLFARTFYQQAETLCRTYPLKLVFAGLAQTTLRGQPGVHAITIPNYSLSDPVPTPPPWAERGTLAMVAGNKYWRTPFRLRWLREPKRLEAWARGKLRLTKSPVKREAARRQLHDERLRLIEFFGQRGHLALHGGGWLEPGLLPMRWRHLRPLLKKLNPRRCADKLAALGQARFALCLENLTYPGYLTEKLIDCFRAGTIPLYRGDPEVTRLVPANAFIDLSQHTDLPALEKKLLAITEPEAQAYLRAGQDFLASPAAHGCSFEGFADQLLEWAQPLLTADHA
jgi:hypothetical protein